MIELEKFGELEGHEHPIYSLSASQKEHILFSGGGEGAVVEWSLKTMKPIKIMFKTKASIYSLHCPKTLPLLISGDREGKISIFHFIEQKLIFQEKLSSSPIFGMISFNNHLYFISEDGFLRILDLHAFQIISEIKISEQALRCISINEEDEMIYVSGKDHKIHHYSIKENRVLRSEEQHTLPVFSLQYDAKNKQLLSGSRDAQIKVWRIDNTINIPAHMYAVNDLLLIPDTDYFVSASMDKSIKVWNAKSLELLAIADQYKNNGHHKSVNALAYIPYQNLILSASDDRMIHVWKLK